MTHLARNPKRMNMAATTTIRTKTEARKAHIRVLGIQIDTKLRWGPQIKKIQENTGDTDVCTYQSSNINMGSVFSTSKACLLCGGTTRYYLWINCLALSPCQKAAAKLLERRRSTMADPPENQKDQSGIPYHGESRQTHAPPCHPPSFKGKNT